MRKTQITLPELALIAATRGLLGAGIGLLLADRLSDVQRKAVGWSLLAIGALSTIPLAVEVLSEIQPEKPNEPSGMIVDRTGAYVG